MKMTLQDPFIFYLNSFQRRISSMKTSSIHTKSTPHRLQRDKFIDPGSSDAPILSTSLALTGILMQILILSANDGALDQLQLPKQQTKLRRGSRIVPSYRSEEDTERIAYSQEKHFLVIGSQILWMDDTNHLMAIDMPKCLPTKFTSHAFTQWIPKRKLVTR